MFQLTSFKLTVFDVLSYTCKGKVKTFMWLDACEAQPKVMATLIYVIQAN